MGAADGTGFRKGPAAVKGVEKGRKEKNFLLSAGRKRICRCRQNLRETPSWRICDEWPRRMGPIGEYRMSQGSLWLYAAAQGLAMLALNLALRVLVS